MFSFKPRRVCSHPALDQLLVSPAMMVDPYPIYRQLREEAPVFWSEQWKAWVVSRFDDVATSLKDKENLSNENRQGLLFASLTDDERQQLCPLRHYFAQKDVIGSDPPDHTRMRALVQKAFTPKTINALEPRIRELAESMVAPAVANGRFDFIHEIAHPLPVVLIAEMLGAPAADRHLFKKWSSDILGFQGTGFPPAASNLYNFNRRGGGMCQVGFVVDNGNCAINPHEDLCKKEITVVGSWAYNSWEYPNAYHFLQRAKKIGIPVEELVTHRFPLAKITEAFQTTLRLEGIKVIVENVS